MIKKRSMFPNNSVRLSHYPNLPFALGIFIVLLYIAPVLIQWENAPVLNSDCLDSNVVYYKMLAESGKVFGSYNTNIEQIMGGIPRNLFFSELNVITLVFALFDPLTAYFLNFSIIHLIAYFGMFFLLSKFIPDGKENPYIIAGVSSTYALLPFYTTNGLSIAGLPLVIYGFLSVLREGWSWQSFIIIVVYTLYSNGIFTGYFLIAVLFLFCLIFSLYRREIQWNGTSVVFILGLLFLICDYRLIWEIFFDTSFLSQRYEFNSLGNTGLTGIEAIGKGYNMLLSGQWHSASLHTDFIFPVVCVSILLILAKRTLNNRYVNNGILFFGFLLVFMAILSDFRNFSLLTQIRGFFLFVTIISWLLIFFWAILRDGGTLFNSTEILLLGLFGCGLFLSITYIFSFWDLTLKMKMMLPVIKGLQLRFYTILPFVWYSLFAVSLLYLRKRVDFPRIFLYGIILIQIVFLFTFHGSPFQTGGVGNLLDQQYSFDQFYSPDLFVNIQKDIGLNPNTYRIASIGLHPAISQYNGFYTIDGYYANYPLSYKHNFREIIASELNKSEKWKQYFDNWGARAYLFSSELSGTAVPKNSGIKITNLEINMTAFKKMGGSYLFSAVKISNAKDIGLREFNYYTTNNSPWEIWVYKVE